MKKLLFFFLTLIGFIKPVFCDDTLQSRIVFYRENNLQGYALTFKILVNGELLIKLRNNAYFNWSCQPGEYTLSFGKSDENNLRLKVENGKTYYVRYELRASFFTTIPGILLVDSLSAYPAISNGKMREQGNPNNPYVRPKNRIGMNMNFGFGFENIVMITSTEGDDSKISFGGGYTIGIKYGREISKYFDLAFDCNYQNSHLRPNLKNANIEFSRGLLSVTPSLIIPVQGGDAMRFKIGAGLDYYFSTSLDIESKKLLNGFNDEWRYNNPLGYHLSAIFELNFSDKWAFNYGLKWYNVRYEFKSGNTFPVDNDLEKPNGSGLDFAFGMYYHF